MIAWVVVCFLVGMYVTGGWKVFFILDILAVGTIIDITPRRWLPTPLIHWYQRELRADR